MTTQLKAGDEVFFHIVQNEANESLVAATVLRVLNNSDVQIKFAVPNEGGETTDTVNLSDLSLALGLDENKAEQKNIRLRARLPTARVVCLPVLSEKQGTGWKSSSARREGRVKRRIENLRVVVHRSKC